MKKILIVEDVEFNRDYLVQLLEQEYEILTAADGAAGIELAERTSPDLILMDLSMPVIDGWEATRRIKANPALKSIPIVALSAHAMRGDEEKARACGCDDYLCKPIDEGLLFDKLRTFLGGDRRDTMGARSGGKEDHAMTKRSRILIVDDDPASVDVLEQELDLLGYETIRATNGQEALEKVATDAPDLILLDVMMPVMDGFTVCRTLKEDEDTRLVPIVIMTALGAVEDRIRGTQAGADDFLTKPVNERELKARIETALKLKHTVDQKMAELRRERALVAFPGLILREKEPENLEFPFSSLNSLITPNEQFFVRSHFAVANLDLDSWRLKIEGMVDHPAEISYDDLLKLPSRTITMTLECAGNSRIFLTPKVGGLQWELGAVGNAEWMGVPLAAVLERARVRAGVVEVILEGADAGEIKKEPQSPGKVHYARGLPLEKALQQDVILAYQMNGTQLSIAHGFPVRAIVPGWYGMASVKWLTRIFLTDSVFRGYFQTLDYTYWEQREGLPIQLLPVGEVEVKAQIARPALHEVVPANSVYRMHGAAWTGESEVTKVEVSTDGGRTWEAAQLLGPSSGYGWRLWEYHWRTPSRVRRQTVMARAADARGHVQPMQRDRHRGNYIISHVQPIEVEVQ